MTQNNEISHPKTISSSPPLFLFLGHFRNDEQHVFHLRMAHPRSICDADDGGAWASGREVEKALRMGEKNSIPPLVSPICNAFNANRSEFMRDNAFRYLGKMLPTASPELPFSCSLPFEAKRKIRFILLNVGLLKVIVLLVQPMSDDGIYFVDFSV